MSIAVVECHIRLDMNIYDGQMLSRWESHAMKGWREVKGRKWYDTRCIHHLCDINYHLSQVAAAIQGHAFSLSLSVKISPEKREKAKFSDEKVVPFLSTISYRSWQSVTLHPFLGRAGNYSVGRSLHEEYVWGRWRLPLTTRHPFANPGCHNNQIALLVPNTTHSFMVMIIISQFALRAEIWFTFPEESHHMTCEMSMRKYCRMEAGKG